MSDEILHSALDIIDSAHTQTFQLTELLNSLQELKQQVRSSAEDSRNKIQSHFADLKSAINEALDARHFTLQDEINKIESEAMAPLTACEEVIQQGIDNAMLVMDEGKTILQNGPENSLEKMIKFKDNPLTKHLTSLPEIPCRSAVPNITVQLSGKLVNQVSELVQNEGRVVGRAPVAITDIEERPGSLLVRWNEFDEDTDLTEFCLQYSYGNIISNDDKNASFHTVYEGPENFFIVKQLRTNTVYSFRVAGRVDSDTPWDIFCIPVAASTSIYHHQWSDNTDGYSASNEDKTATRTNEGVTCVLYSKTASISPGEQVTFKILDAGEKALGDGLGLAWSTDNKESLVGVGTVFVNINGYVFVDGLEMKMRLPPLTKGSALTFQTEPLPNGKVRILVQIKDKEMAFDWKIEQPVDLLNFAGLPQMGFPLQRQASANQMFFALKFSHEYWKVGVE
ncbi:cytokine receptor-like factor 3 [Gigantopelta aegis]|uniref:cytokine receptor-like factor 3 n=1 Tax=Gigantopelta aegis TaxID=1735272 RepID=UPI001B88BB3C|nr:cytokine receptor-like factor 3 [Gigantopelta aegis]